MDASRKRTRGWWDNLLERLGIRPHPPLPPDGGIFDPGPEPGWQPSVMRPSFYGTADYGVADGAPGPMRVFFPSLDGSPPNAAILDGVGRYPLVLFLHGQCDETAPGPAHYLRWDLAPSQLARSGFVVVMPQLDSDPPFGEGGAADVAVAEQALLWMRTSWAHAGLLMPRPMTAVVGHSWGALAGAVIAERLQAQGAISAFASLSGGWLEWPSTPPLPLGLNMAAMFMWGTGDSDNFANLEGPNASIFALPRGATHKIVFNGGEHFDYFRPGSTECGKDERGTCPLMRPLAADFLATFLSHYMPPQKWSSLSSTIPHSLVPPPLNLTPAQEFFAGGHLQGFAAIATATGCRVTHTWRLPPLGGGSVTLGPG